MNKNNDIESLARESLNYLKSNYDLPSKGFLAGGSIANLIWEKVSGNKSVINDIDIFIYTGIHERENTSSISKYENDEKIDFLSVKSKLDFDYSGISRSYLVKDYYKITNVENKGKINIVEYKASTDRKDLVLDSFDINCVNIGYSIEEDKFYWKNDFEEFLNTGELKLSNLLTPAHSAIRLIKKKHELNCKLDDFEFDLLKIALKLNYFDINKIYFSDKYSLIYDKYKNDLDKHFRKVKSEEITEKFKNHEKLPNIQIYNLLTLNDNDNLENDNSILYVINSSDALFFYVRNILPYNDKKVIWQHLNVFYNTKNYFDCEIELEDIELISRIIKYAPLSILNLNELRLSEQLKLIKRLFNKFSHDPIVAVCLLEKVKLDINKEYDDNDYLLLELSVRKEILENDRRVNLIFGLEKDILDF